MPECTNANDAFDSGCQTLRGFSDRDDTTSTYPFWVNGYRLARWDGQVLPNTVELAPNARQFAPLRDRVFLGRSNVYDNRRAGVFRTTSGTTTHSGDRVLAFAGATPDPDLYDMVQGVKSAKRSPPHEEAARSLSVVRSSLPVSGYSPYTNNTRSDPPVALLGSVIVEGSESRPDFENGTDRHNFGALLGRGGLNGRQTRKLAWLQNQALTTSDHAVAQQSGPGFTVDAFTISSLDELGFACWFKPAQTIPGTKIYWNGRAWEGLDPSSPPTMVLVSWHSGKPVPCGATIVTPSGSTVPNVRWGAECWLVVYLTAVPEGWELGAEFTMPCKEDRADEDIPSLMDASYVRRWSASRKIVPGTWHHLTTSFWASRPNKKSPLPGGNVNTALFLDGVVQASEEPEPRWPSERDPAQRLLEHAVAQVDSSVTVSPVTTVSVRIPPGQCPPAALMQAFGLPSKHWTAGTGTGNPPSSSPPMDGVCIWWGGVSPADEVAWNDPIEALGKTVGECLDFRGFVDEIQISPKTLAGGKRARYDESRLTYKRHVPELEVERPVFALGATATCWDGTTTETPRVDALPFKLTWAGDTVFTTAASRWSAFLNESAFGRRSGSAEPPGGFLTVACREHIDWEGYYYSVQLPAPVTKKGESPAMAPILDDVTITYASWAGPRCLLEEELP